MTRDDIIRMAREQGCPETATHGVFLANADDLGRLLAAEREACCSGEVVNAAKINGDDCPHQVVAKYQAAIRARRQA